MTAVLRADPATIEALAARVAATGGLEGGVVAGVILAVLLTNPQATCRKHLDAALLRCELQESAARYVGGRPLTEGKEWGLVRAVVARLASEPGTHWLYMVQSLLEVLAIEAQVEGDHPSLRAHLGRRVRPAPKGNTKPPSDVYPASRDEWVSLAADAGSIDSARPVYLAPTAFNQQFHVAQGRRATSCFEDGHAWQVLRPWRHQHAQPALRSTLRCLVAVS